MTLDEARELVNGPLWERTRDDYLATGEFAVIPSGDPRRLKWLDEETRRRIDAWLEVLSRADELKLTVDGAKVRRLKEEFPGAYPEALRYSAYFTRFGGGALKDDFEAVKLLMKLKFPEAYRLCCS